MIKKFVILSILSLLCGCRFIDMKWNDGRHLTIIDLGDTKIGGFKGSTTSPTTQETVEFNDFDSKADQELLLDMSKLLDKIPNTTLP